MALYLGFDAGTQRLTAVVIEIDGATRRVVHENALTYDEELPHYATRHGVLPDADPRVGVSGEKQQRERCPCGRRRPDVIDGAPFPLDGATRRYDSRDRRGGGQPRILQVMADVFGADVYQLRVSHSAALGAALRAAHARMRDRDPSTSWNDVVVGLAEPDAGSRIVPQRDRHAFYRDMLKIYAACEAHALGRGPDPAPLLDRIASRTPQGPASAPVPYTLTARCATV